MGERSMVGKQSAWPEGSGYVTCSCAADGPGPPILATYHTPGEYVQFALARGKRTLAGEIIPVVMVNNTRKWNHHPSRKHTLITTFANLIVICNRFLVASRSPVAR